MPSARALLCSIRMAFCALGPLALAAGCGFLGGQGTDSGGECRSQETELDGDERVSPLLGFAPAEVLSWASGPRSVNARWNEPPAGTTASSTPGDVEVTFSIERAPGAAVEVVPGEGCVGEPHLRVPVTLSFASADGQLDERWEAALTAVRTGYARATADVELASLQGGLQWRSATSSVALVQPSLALAITPMSNAGSFGAAVETRTANARSVAPGAGGSILVWPADSPCGGAVPRAPDEQDALYVDAIARAAASAWVDAQGAEYALSVSSADQLCEAEQGELTLPASVSLRGGGGVIDLTLDGWFVREGEQLHYDPAGTRGLGAAPANFVERFGDFGLDLSGYEHVSIEFGLMLSATGGSTTLRVIGYRDECRPVCDRSSCSGCGPFKEEGLLEVVLSQRE